MKTTRKQGYRPKQRTVSLKSSAWKQLRALVLAEEPLCRWCLARGLFEPSTDVDHINNDGDDNRRENLAGMCHSCHSVKTARDMGKGMSQGHDVNGLPLDPNHPWSRAAHQIGAKRSPATQPDGTARSLLFYR